MTVEKSTRVANRIASPSVVNVKTGNGVLHSGADTKAVANGADADSVVFDIAIPVDAAIRYTICAPEGTEPSIPDSGPICVTR